MKFKNFANVKNNFSKIASVPLIHYINADFMLLLHKNHYCSESIGQNLIFTQTGLKTKFKFIVSQGAAFEFWWIVSLMSYVTDFSVSQMTKMAQ